MRASRLHTSLKKTVRKTPRGSSGPLNPLYFEPCIARLSIVKALPSSRTLRLQNKRRLRCTCRRRLTPAAHTTDRREDHLATDGEVNFLQTALNH